MYTVKKRMEIAGSHRLELDYESKCQNLHGHNWIVIVTCKSEALNHNGMVVDFTEIKKKIHDFLDHKNLNDLFNFNPTAENIARWIFDNTPFCVVCEVQESEGNIAIYEKNI